MTDNVIKVDFGQVIDERLEEFIKHPTTRAYIREVLRKDWDKYYAKRFKDTPGQPPEFLVEQELRAWWVGKKPVSPVPKGLAKTLEKLTPEEKAEMIRFLNQAPSPGIKSPGQLADEAYDKQYREPEAPRQELRGPGVDEWNERKEAP